MAEFDFDELSRLYARAFPNAAHIWSPADFKTFIQNPHNNIYTNPYGAMLITQITDQAEIISLFVDPKSQKQGHASRIWNDFIASEATKGIKRVYLEVAENNRPAIQFYQQIGFKTEGIRKSYYKTIQGNQIDGITMVNNFT